MSELHCVFEGCDRLLVTDGDGWTRHAESPPEGIARHVPHYDINGMRIIDLTEMDERADDSAVTS